MKRGFKYLILLGITLSCGNTTHKIKSDIPNKIEVIHKIDISDIEATFINDCEEQFEDQNEIDACVQQKIDELLDFLKGLT